MDMSVAKCLDCYVLLEEIICSYTSSGFAYRCPQCKLEYTPNMYESLVRQYKELWGEDFSVNVFEADSQKDGVIMLGSTTSHSEEPSDSLKKLLEDDRTNTEEEANDAIAAYEQPIQEC